MFGVPVTSAGAAGFTSRTPLKSLKGPNDSAKSPAPSPEGQITRLIASTKRNKTDAQRGQEREEERRLKELEKGWDGSSRVIGHGQENQTPPKVGQATATDSRTPSSAARSPDVTPASLRNGKGPRRLTNSYLKSSSDVTSRSLTTELLAATSASSVKGATSSVVVYMPMVKSDAESEVRALLANPQPNTPQKTPQTRKVPGSGASHASFAFSPASTPDSLVCSPVTRRGKRGALAEELVPIALAASLNVAGSPDQAAPSKEFGLPSASASPSSSQASPVASSKGHSPARTSAGKALGYVVQPDGSPAKASSVSPQKSSRKSPSTAVSRGSSVAQATQPPYVVQPDSSLASPVRGEFKKSYKSWQDVAADWEQLIAKDRSNRPASSKAALKQSLPPNSSGQAIQRRWVTSLVSSNSAARVTGPKRQPSVQIAQTAVKELSSPLVPTGVATTGPRHEIVPLPPAVSQVSPVAPPKPVTPTSIPSPAQPEKDVNLSSTSVSTSAALGVPGYGYPVVSPTPGFPFFIGQFGQFPPPQHYANWPLSAPPGPYSPQQTQPFSYRPTLRGYW